MVIKRGRPKKPVNEKENPVAIRMSLDLIAELKKEAEVLGIGWQTMVKNILMQALKKRKGCKGV
jgi:uncharacterized protein (DUF4415 family)